MIHTKNTPLINQNQAVKYIPTTLEEGRERNREKQNPKTENKKR